MCILLKICIIKQKSAFPMNQFPQPQPSKPESRTASKWFLVLVACLIAGGGYGLTKLNTHDYTPESVEESIAVTTKANMVDTLSADEIKKRNQDFAVIRETKSLATLPTQDALNALKENHFNEDIRIHLASKLAEGEMKMIKLKLWDDVAEDGDFVAVTTGGMRTEIQIMHHPITVALPVVGGTPIQIEGIKDGGGGITLGVGDDHFVATPVLKEGEIINIQAY